MKLTIISCALVLTACALPCTAQVSAPQQNTSQQNTSHTSTYADLIQALKSMHRFSGSRYPFLPPQEKAQVDATMATINDLTKAGTEALHLKNFVAAEDDYRQLIQVEPSYPYNYYGLGEALAGEGKTAEALAAYRTAVNWPLNRDPQAIAFSQAMGGSMSNLRGCCGPADAIGWMKCTLLLSQTGQNEEALSVYSQAIHFASDISRSGISLLPTAGPSSPAEFQAAAHLALGLMSGDMPGDHERAMTEFAQALQLAPDSAAANFYYGYGWKRLDLQSKTRLADAPQAKAALQKAALADDENVKEAASNALRGLH